MPEHCWDLSALRGQNLPRGPAAPLLVFLGSAGAQPQLTSEQNAISLSAGKYRHLDRATNQELICDKCPAGTYVSKHCTKSTLRECSPCPDGTFTKHENGIERCHPCRKPCELPMIEKTHCTALTDRECTCLSGTFQTNDTYVRCKPCPRGTFSDVPSSVMKCKTYTDCFGKNMVVVKPGTKESDNVCGSPASLPSTSLASSDAEAGGETYEAPPTTHLPKGNRTSCSPAVFPIHVLCWHKSRCVCGKPEQGAGAAAKPHRERGASFHPTDGFVGSLGGFVGCPDGFAASLPVLSLLCFALNCITLLA
uniref:TNFR-Cys domain-containing protein n=1 Tax=Anas zonorhyncha TaxID=75864 RepID=A0A8B9V353_9AVES